MTRFTGIATAAAAVLLCAGCAGKRAAPAGDGDGLGLGLAHLMQEAPPADPSPPEPPAPADDEQALADLIARETAALEEAFAAANPPPPAGDGGAAHRETAGASASLAEMAAGEGLEAELSGPETTTEASPDAMDAATEAVSEPEPDRLTVLLAELDGLLGREMASDSEPLKTALAMVALAAAQGDDPQAVLAADSPAASKLSPTELRSAQAVAELFAALLSPQTASPDERARALDRISQKLAATGGVTIPRAELCTRVTGFGKYAPFDKTDFLAGRPIRALLYVEVDRFEHKPLDTTSLGLPVEDRWAIELSQELRLTHKGQEATLAWRRPAEKVVETSRNRQRDFYLLTEIELPRTLSIGSYELKITVRDGVSGSEAERVIPIGIVADPALAWQGR